MLFNEYEEERDSRISKLINVALDEDLDYEEILKALDSCGEYKTKRFQVCVSYEPADVTVELDSDSDIETVVNKYNAYVVPDMRKVVIHTQLPIFHYQGRA